MRNKIMCLVSLSLCVAAVLIVQQSYTTEVKIGEQQYLLNNVTENCGAVLENGEIVRCDRAALSNIVLRLQNEGYELTTRKDVKKGMDIILQKDETIHRILYYDNGNFANFASPYEERLVLETYINERK